MTKKVLQDKSTPLYEMLCLEKVRELMNNPNALDAPWYGQLMRGPQVLAYIVQTYYWIKDNDVKFV